jgi:uncharacterized protein with HEPN domain
MSHGDWRMYADDIVRDVLAHDYFGMDLKVVWSTVTTKLDDLEVAVRTLLGRSSGS